MQAVKASTEDSLGYAESFTGGVTWVQASNRAVNTNGIRTSDLLTQSSSIIRGNGFPRIDVDRTCGPFAGYIYAVMSEKNLAPAKGVADVVLMRTTDGGDSWTRTKVNQNTDSTKYEYFPAVRVDETGGVNVCYYSTRNVPTNDSAQIYLSRSTDGGATFTDVLISDHKFKPMPISGLAAGYQGDYIGITSGGSGKILPYWCEQGSSGGRYQAWTALVDINKLSICEDFSCTSFGGIPSANLYEEWTGTNYWARFDSSAYDVGSGSARFNSWSAPGGTVQSLVSYNFTPLGSNIYLTFDEAYGPWVSGFTNEDSLIVESSTNNGAAWTNLARLWGSLAGGPLNTAPAGGQFTPSPAQWAPKIYLLPSGTNKIRLRAVSDFGNDIWVDNVCVKVIHIPVANSLGVIPEGMFNCSSPYHTQGESVRIYLHRSDFPNIAVDSGTGIINTNGTATGINFNNAISGTYYKKIVHRNTITTWSKAGGESFIRGSSNGFNMILPAGQAFANNQHPMCQPNDWWGMFSGDVNKDGQIDVADIVPIFNDAINFVVGDNVNDLTGDDFVDVQDVVLCYNNSVNFVMEVAPPGAGPMPAPSVEEVVKNSIVTNEIERQKLELTLKTMREKNNQEIQNSSSKETENEVFETLKKQ